MEFDWWNTIQACEKLPNVHVVQWLGVFWFHGMMECKVFGMWIVSEGVKKTRFNLKMIQHG